jgi:hypothetical protein
MKVLKLFILCLITFTILTVHARMYQWVDPISKSTQFSGKPPVWYRSKNSGPRIIVFDDNRIIDDTNIRVSDVEQERLRRQAFLRAEADREAAKEKLLKAKRLEAISEQMQGDQEHSAAAAPGPAEQAGATTIAVTAPAPPAAITDEAVVNQMRMLIQEWEKQSAASARALIEPGAPASR